MKTFEEFVAEGLGTALVNATIGKPLRDIKNMKDYLEQNFVTDDKGNKYDVPKTGLKQGYQWYYNNSTHRVDQRKLDDKKKDELNKNAY